MNILFYIDRYPGVGGIENVSTAIIGKLQQYHVIYVISNCQQVGVECPSFINLLKMPDSNNEESSQNFNYLLDIIKKYGIEAIVYQDSYGNTYSNLCKAIEETKLPLYVFEHNSPLFIYNKRDLDPITTAKGLLRRLLHPYLLHKEIARKRCLLEHSKKYVLLSKHFIPEFCNLIGADVHDTRITYINNPAKPIEYGATILKENIILCVTRLAQEKCVDLMINMWADLSTQLPDWRFVVVGDGPEKPKLEGIVKKNNIPRVKFTGFAEPTKFYQKSKIFWMTSKFEGWGMTLVEAMQHGCVPIGYETYSSIRDIIDSGRNGYLVNPDDETTFKEYTVQLAKDDNHRSILADLAVKKTEVFSVNTIINKWINLFE